MKEERLSIRLSAKRYQKLKDIAESEDKTITQVVEGWIDKSKKPH